MNDEVLVTVELTNAYLKGFELRTTLKNGGREVDRPTLKMNFTLTGPDTMKASYENQKNKDTGLWKLARKKL